MCHHNTGKDALASCQCVSLDCRLYDGAYLLVTKLVTPMWKSYCQGRLVCISFLFHLLCHAMLFTVYPNRGSALGEGGITIDMPVLQPHGPLGVGFFVTKL